MVDVETIEKQLFEEQKRIRELEDLLEEHVASKRMKMDDSAASNDQKGSELCTNVIVNNDPRTIEIEKELTARKNNVLMLQSSKNRILNPVSLCPDLYLEVFINAATEKTSFDYEQSQKKKLENVIKYELIGKESISALIELFKESTSLTFRSNVSCTFKRFMLDSCESMGNLSKKLVEIAASHVTSVRFEGSDYLRYSSFGSDSEWEKAKMEIDDCHYKWHDVFFDALSKNSHQKELQIHNLREVGDNVVAALENMTEKGVVITLYDTEDEVLEDLPPLDFDTVAPKNIDVLDKLECTFRKLEIYEPDEYDYPRGDDFVVDYIKEIYMEHPKGFLRDFFLNSLKQWFPNADKVVIDLEIDFSSPTYFDHLVNDSSSDCISEIVEDVENASQKEILVTVSVSTWDEPSQLIQDFNGEQIGENCFEKKSKNNEKKIVRLDV